jgi:hypothetical protein
MFRNVVTRSDRAAVLSHQRAIVCGVIGDRGTVLIRSAASLFLL